MTKAYTRPALRIQGSLEAMTHGGSDGNVLDRNFPVNTPRGDLTFS